MGCDIHFYVEKKNTAGKWASADAWARGNGDDRPGIPCAKRFYFGRNYDLFGILANVRNGRGFAGVDTGDGFVPITGEDTRGMPDDTSPEVNAECEAWDGDGHSHQYLTLRELLDYDWTRATKHPGMIDLDEYLRWQDSYELKYEGPCSPRSWCGAASGPKLQNLPEAEVKGLIEGALAEGKRSNEELAAFVRAKHPGETINVAAEWETPYYESTTGFFSRTMPRLLALAAGEYDSVRCVFWFDN